MAILAIKLKMINQDRMIFADCSVNFKPISLKFCKGYFAIQILTRLELQKFILFFCAAHLPVKLDKETKIPISYFGHACPKYIYFFLI